MIKYLLGIPVGAIVIVGFTLLMYYIGLFVDKKFKITDGRSVSADKTLRTILGLAFVVVAFFVAVICAETGAWVFKHLGI